LHAIFSWSGKLPLQILTCNLIYNILSSNLFFFSFVITDYNLLVWWIFFIIPFSLKSRVTWSRDLTWFDTNINLISIHIDSCFCFKFTHTLLSDTYIRWHYFCFVNLWYRDLVKTSIPKLEIFENLCILLKFFKKLSSPL